MLNHARLDQRSQPGLGDFVPQRRGGVRRRARVRLGPRQHVAALLGRVLCGEPPDDGTDGVARFRGVDVRRVPLGERVTRTRHSTGFWLRLGALSVRSVLHDARVGFVVVEPAMPLRHPAGSDEVGERVVDRPAVELRFGANEPGRRSLLGAQHAHDGVAAGVRLVAGVWHDYRLRLSGQMPVGRLDTDARVSGQCQPLQTRRFNGVVSAAPQRLNATTVHPKREVASRGSSPLLHMSAALATRRVPRRRRSNRSAGVPPSRRVGFDHEREHDCGRRQRGRIARENHRWRSGSRE
ncbi:hypothetical protein AFNJKBDN_CDS0023 [Halorubrum virus V_ICIS4]|nr:hypothetical protein AFNJKBDN_CDS0023 [Halorubrum virus V_ICIS4]